MEKSINQKPSMPSVLAQVNQILSKTIQVTFDIKFEVTITPILDKPYFDYQVPSALTLFNNYKSQNSFGFKNAQELGNEIKSKLIPNDVIESLEVNDKGFMFVKVKESFVEKQINILNHEGVNYFSPDPKIIAVDFSSPNIAKELHVGHLRSTILGASISKIFEFMGHNVLKINHVGDWGTQFGMLICHLQEEYPDYKTSLPSVSHLTNFYKDASKKFKEDAEFKKKSQETVVKLQAGDPDCLDAWEKFCELSRKENNKIYKKLNITSHECGESFYNPMLPSIVEEFTEKGLVEISDGAKCIFFKDKGIDAPLMIQKSDGGYNYDTTDLAAAKYRLQVLKADKLLYLTDFGQKSHFDLVFYAAEKAGWYDPKKTSMEHMGFGFVLGEDGKRLKTREGDNVPFSFLISEGTKLSIQNLKERLNASGQIKDWTEEMIDEVGEKIAISAIKYFELKQSRVSNYKFSFKNMLDASGNTAVYLLYSYVRLCSILKKSEIKEEELKSGEFKITHPFERYLGLAVLRLPEVLDVVSKELAIHKLCDYIYNLAVTISTGYGKYKILDPEHQKTRLMLILAVKKAMKQAFELIGIDPIEKI